MTCKVWIYLAQVNSPQKQSHALLQAALRCWAEATGREDAEVSVIRPRYQKPYLKDFPAVDISVSRSGGYWACAISEQKVGLDLQQETFVGTERITRRFLHEQEQRYLQMNPRDFFKVWTAKESYVKLTGEGVTDQFGDFSVAEDGRLKDTLKGAAFRYLDAPEGYVLCLCAADPDDLEINSL